MINMNNKEKLVELQYDKFKTYTFYIFAAIITLAIGYTSTKAIIFGISSLTLIFPFIISIIMMEICYSHLMRIYEKNSKVEEQKVSKKGGILSRRVIRSVVFVIAPLLMLWAILIFFGYFDLINNVEFLDAEPIIINNTPQYVINVQFVSKGAFIEGQPIDFYIEVQRIGVGEKFVDGINQFWISGSCPVYSYPLNKSGPLNLYIGGVVKLSVTDDGDKLTGHDTIVFLKSGQCGKFKLQYVTENSQRFHLSNIEIYIAPSNAGLDLEFNRRIMSLTLITLALALIQLTVMTQL